MGCKGVQGLVALEDVASAAGRPNVAPNMAWAVGAERHRDDVVYGWAAAVDPPATVSLLTAKQIASAQLAGPPKVLKDRQLGDGCVGGAVVLAPSLRAPAAASLNAFLLGERVAVLQGRECAVPGTELSGVSAGAWAECDAALETRAEEFRDRRL
jgi:hypothetical protein